MLSVSFLSMLDSFLMKMSNECCNTCIHMRDIKKSDEHFIIFVIFRRSLANSEWIVAIYELLKRNWSIFICILNLTYIMKYRPIGWYISRRKRVKTSVTKLGFGRKKSNKIARPEYKLLLNRPKNHPLFQIKFWTLSSEVVDLTRYLLSGLLALRPTVVPQLALRAWNWRQESSNLSTMMKCWRPLQWSELLIIRSRSLHNKQSPITSQHQVLYVQEETRHRLDLRSQHKRFPGLADWLIVGKEGKHSCEFVHSSQVLLRPFRNVFNSRNSCGLWTCRWSIDW